MNGNRRETTATVKSGLRQLSENLAAARELGCVMSLIEWLRSAGDDARNEDKGCRVEVLDRLLLQR